MKLFNEWQTKFVEHTQIIHNLRIKLKWSKPLKCALEFARKQLLALIKGSSQSNFPLICKPSLPQ